MSILKRVVKLTESERSQNSGILTTEDCNEIIKQSIDKANELEVLMNIAIVDCTGELMAFMRMDGAWLGSVHISQNKAYTAHAFSGDKDKQGPLTTEKLGELAQPGEPLYGIQDTNTKIVVFGGGVPLYKGNVLVGALGISGSTVPNDIKVAEAGAKGFE